MDDESSSQTNMLVLFKGHGLAAYMFEGPSQISAHQLHALGVDVVVASYEQEQAVNYEIFPTSLPSGGTAVIIYQCRSDLWPPCIRPFSVAWGFQSSSSSSTRPKW